MSKPNKDGWIRHRGGKCPVEAGVWVDVKHRDSCVYSGVPAGVWMAANWGHSKHQEDIMAYRIHKPAEQPVIEPDTYADGKYESSEPVQVTYSDADGPLEWRDRITEIDATIEALEEERESLVQRLEDEGFRLIERVNAGIADAMQAHEDMSDWRNWMVGDLVECVSKANKWTKKEYIEIGSILPITHTSNDDDGLNVMVKSYWLDPSDFKWHSRPSK